MHIFRVVLLLLRQRYGAAGNGLGTTIKYLRRTTMAPRATAWAPRPSTCAAPRALTWAPRSSTCDAQRVNGLGATINYLRCTTSGAAGNSLDTTTKYLRGAAGISLGATVKYVAGANLRPPCGTPGRLPPVSTKGSMSGHQSSSSSTANTHVETAEAAWPLSLEGLAQNCFKSRCGATRRWASAEPPVPVVLSAHIANCATDPQKERPAEAKRRRC